MVRNKTGRKLLVLLFLFLVGAAVVLPASTALAEKTKGEVKLPWEDPLEQIVDSLTGYWAYAIVIIAFVASAAMMFFGQAEMQGWVRNLVFLILVASFLMGGGMWARRLLGLKAMLLP